MTGFQPSLDIIDTLNGFDWLEIFAAYSPEDKRTA